MTLTPYHTNAIRFFEPQTSALGIWDYVVLALGEFGNEFEVEEIVVELTDSIRDMLPKGYVMLGNEIFRDIEVAKLTDEQIEDLREKFELVDFWAMAERHG